MERYSTKINSKLSAANSNPKPSCWTRVTDIFSGVGIASVLNDVDKKYYKQQEQVIDLFVKINAACASYVEAKSKKPTSADTVEKIKEFMAQIDALLKPLHEQAKTREQVLVKCAETHNSRSKFTLKFKGILLSLANINTHNDAILQKLSKFSKDTVSTVNAGLETRVKQKEEEIRGLQQQLANNQRELIEVRAVHNDLKRELEEVGA